MLSRNFECPFCGGDLIEIWSIERPDGGFGKPITEHHHECTGCGFHALFTEILDTELTSTQKRKIMENLRRLGYV